MDRFYMFIATGAYSGYLPKAPGTWGSLAGILLWLVVGRLELATYLLLLLALLILGVIAAGAAEKIVDLPDPGLVVIDEVVGQLVVLTGASLHLPVLVAGFLLFRFFDIVKPFPAGWLDRHIHGGLGIMLDDLVAGLYGLLALQAGLHFLGP